MVNFGPTLSDRRTKNNAVRHQYRVLTEAEKKAVVAVKRMLGSFSSPRLDRECHPGHELSTAEQEARRSRHVGGEGDNPIGS